MKSIIALTWKEYRQIRWFLIIGLAIFLIFPLYEDIDSYIHGYKHSYQMSAIMAVFFGGIFTIFVAVAITTADLRTKLDTFWLSRPINPLKLLTIKYIIGLTTTLLVISLPIIIQICFLRVSDFTVKPLYNNTFTLITIYSTAFIIGCLARKPVYATMLAVAAALLIYFLPVLIPPLRFLCPSEILLNDSFGIAYVISETLHGRTFYRNLFLDNQFYPYSFHHLLNIPFTTLTIYFTTNWLIYVALALASCPIAIFLSALTIRRNYRVNLNQKSILWSLGIIALLLWSTVAYQLGSNLTCLRRIPFGDEYYIDPLAVSPEKIAEAEKKHQSTNKSPGYDNSNGAVFDNQGRITAILVFPPNVWNIYCPPLLSDTGKAYFQYNESNVWSFGDERAQRSTHQFLCSIDLNQLPDPLIRIDAVIPVSVSSCCGNCCSSMPLLTEDNTYTYRLPVLWSPNEPENFFCRRLERNTDSTYSLYLCTFAISPDTARPTIINKLDITPYIEPSFQHNPPQITQGYKTKYSSAQEIISSSYRIFIYNKLIYMHYGDKYLAIDITSPAQPELVTAYNYRHSANFSETETYLPRFGLGLENFTLEDDINIAINFGFSSWPPESFDGTHLVKADRQGISVYEISQITDSHVTFTKVAHHSITPLESLLGTRISNIFLRNNQIYVSRGGSITVFDISDLPKIKKVGHYSSPNHIYNIAPMPDGNILAKTRHDFQIIAPPPSATTGHTSVQK